MSDTLVAEKYAIDRFENEVMLLGSLLSNSSIAYRAVASILEPKHFSDPFNMALFRLIGEAVDAGLDGFRRTHWVMTEIRGSAALQETNTSASAMIARYIKQAGPLIGVEPCARLVMRPSDSKNASLHSIAT